MKVAILSIDYEGLAKALGFPSGVSIVAARLSERMNGLDFRLEGEGLPKSCETPGHPDYVPRQVSLICRQSEIFDG